jgi:DNA-binding NarL/FixJ family response regulator
MNKINVSIIAAPRAAMQECIDLIEELPEIHVVAMPAGLSAQATWMALASTDVVIIDEAVIEQEGFAPLQLLLESYPRLRCLVVMEKYNKNKMIWTMLRGVRGVMCEDEALSLLPKAIRHLHAGEVWMARDLQRPLRHALQSRQDWFHTRGDQADSRHWMKWH